MAKLDLCLIKCPLHEINTVRECQMCCDWYGRKESPPTGDNELFCGFTDEVLPIIHRTVDIDLDIDVIRQPQQQELKPCEAVGCIQKGE